MIKEIIAAGGFLNGESNVIPILSVEDEINLSEIGKGSGINIKNGMTFEELSALPYEEAKEQIELVYDDVEGMPHERAIELRNQYGKNVGTILVGMNNDHVIAAMGADDVDFIIPFHKSGWSQNELDRMPVLNSYDDYTDSQNERIILGKKCSHRQRYAPGSPAKQRITPATPLPRVTMESSRSATRTGM